jgi:hypothetical protein
MKERIKFWLEIGFYISLIVAEIIGMVYIITEIF